MKTSRSLIVGIALASSFTLRLSTVLQAATTINSAHKYTYGANIGWMDWRGETNSGAVIGEYVCSGYIYSANVGWIHLGSNAPRNGIQHQNNSATDYGVNHDGLGNLRGLAYGANIGWVTFENSGAPTVHWQTGKLSGSIYSANCGWISLSNTFACVQTDAIAPGTDSDGDGIADAWEWTYTNTLTAFTASSDTDGDGVSDKNEYLADTNPTDDADYLRITSITHGNPMPTATVLLWTSKPKRYYAIQRRAALDAGSPWVELAVISLPGVNHGTLTDLASSGFYRIRAARPLTP
jgi:hypothetical protein